MPSINTVVNEDLHDGRVIPRDSRDRHYCQEYIRQDIGRLTAFFVSTGRTILLQIADNVCQLSAWKCKTSTGQCSHGPAEAVVTCPFPLMCRQRRSGRGRESHGSRLAAVPNRLLVGRLANVFSASLYTGPMMAGYLSLQGAVNGEWVRRRETRVTPRPWRITLALVVSSFPKTTYRHKT